MIERIPHHQINLLTPRMTRWPQGLRAVGFGELRGNEMAYTAEDFDKCRDSFTAWDDGADRIILAALSIASAVMRPGVIEEALDSFDDLVSPEAIAEIIRAALTESHDGN